MVFAAQYQVYASDGSQTLPVFLTKNYQIATTVYNDQQNVFTNPQVIQIPTGSNIVPSDAVLQTVGSNTVTNYYNDVYGAIPGLICRRADGTLGSPTAVLQDEELGKLSVRPYNGTAFASSAFGKFAVFAAENFSTSANGTYASIFTTKKTTLTLSEVARFQDDGTWKIWNPNLNFAYVITPGVISAERIINLPVITATDTFAVLTLPQTFVGAKTFPANGIILGGAGAGLGTLTYANSASSGTLTFPAATDTLVALSTTDRLANKDLIDISTTISNVSASSKAIAFSLSGMTAAKVLTIASLQTTSQTLTIPNLAQASTLVVLEQANTYTAGAKQTFQNSSTTAGINLATSADPSTLSTGDFWYVDGTGLKFRDSGGTSRVVVTTSNTQTLTLKTLTIPKITASADPAAAAGQFWLSSTNVDVLKYSNATTLFTILSTKMATLAGTPADPTGTTSTSGVMMGLNQTITPANTTRMVVKIMGQMAASLLNGTCTVQLRTGTGTAPANADAATGTQRGSSQTVTALIAAEKSGFCIEWVLTGLTIGTAIWIDANVISSTGSTATITGVTVTAYET